MIELDYLEKEDFYTAEYVLEDETILQIKSPSLAPAKNETVVIDDKTFLVVDIKFYPVTEKLIVYLKQ